MSYTLSDFLMFGPDVYWRLFELHNRASWPLPLAALAAGILTLALASIGRTRAATLLLAAGWAGAAHFLATRYAPINWPAKYAAAVFGLQAILLAASGILAGLRPVPGPRRWLGLGLLAYAVLLHPVAGVGFGRPLSQAEVAGLAPDPTALATLGLLLLAGQGIWTGVLAIVPLIWCLVSAVTLLTLGEAQGWIPLLAVVLWAAGRAAGVFSGRGTV